MSCFNLKYLLNLSYVCFTLLLKIKIVYINTLPNFYWTLFLTVVSRNYFASVAPINGMVKVANKRKLKWCLLHYEVGDTTSKWAANHLSISQRRFQQIYKEYQTTKEMPSIGKDVGRPKKKKYLTDIKQ